MTTVQQLTRVEHEHPRSARLIAAARSLPFLLPMLPVAEQAGRLGWLTRSPGRDLLLAGALLGAALLTVWWQRRRRFVSGVVLL